jgi:hypothetical protein
MSRIQSSYLRQWRRMACNRPLLELSPRSTDPRAQAVWNVCWPAREQCWALRGLSSLYRDDADALRIKSGTLIARSHLLRGYPTDHRKSA